LPALTEAEVKVVMAEMLKMVKQAAKKFFSAAESK
jgi:hypothetical protein